jgi:integrase
MKRHDKGSGSVWRTKFKTKEGKEKLGGWRYKFTHKGVTYNESVPARNKDEAREGMKRRMNEVMSGSFIKGSEAETLRYETMRGYLLRHYETKGCKSLRAARSGEKFIGNLKHLDDFFRGKLALDIDARLLDDFIIERQRAGAANGTINRALGLLGQMFHLAVAPNKVLHREQVPAFSRLKEADARQGFLEPEDFPRLRESLPEYLRTILTLAYYTGMRKEEVLSLQWKNVDLLDGVLLLVDTKNGKSRKVPLNNDEILKMLKMERARHPRCPWVFSLNGRAPIGSFRKAWRTACVSSGFGRFVCRGCAGELDVKSHCVACGKQHSNSNAKLPVPDYAGLLFHDLRRSGVRNLVRSGVPESVAMKISGHLSRDVFERYNITSDRDVKEAMAKVTAHNRDLISKRLAKVEAETPSVEADQKTVVQ